MMCPPGSFIADFLGAVEGGANRHHDRRTFECGDCFVNIADFNVEESRAFAHDVRAIWVILLDAGEGLVHQFDVVFHEDHEG